MTGFGGYKLPGERFKDPRIKLAQALMAGSVQRRPDTHWMQGLGRMSKMLASNYVSGLANTDAENDRNELFKAMYGNAPTPDAGPLGKELTAQAVPPAKSSIGQFVDPNDPLHDKVVESLNRDKETFYATNPDMDYRKKTMAPEKPVASMDEHVLEDVEATGYSTPTYPPDELDRRYETVRAMALQGNRTAQTLLPAFEQQINSRNMKRESDDRAMRNKYGFDEHKRAADLEDFEYKEQWKLDNAPKPEKYETVKNPYGLGGVGQRSSKTGKIEGYQAPKASPSTNDIKNYEYAVSKGYDGDFNSFVIEQKKAGAMVMNPLQEAQLGKLRRKEKSLSSKARNSLGGFQRKMKIVNDEVGKAMNIISNSGMIGGTGWHSFLSVLPGTDARELENAIKTIRANIGFDELQSMRENSPTGGALGSVSENENALLQAVKGALDPAGSDETLIQNLQRIQKLYMAVMREKQLAFESDFGERFSNKAESPTKVPGSRKFKVLRRID